jgi:3,4-dihydroxy 2-butanone 4-phosphate synthase/GTP cyclohydrolase II
VDLGLTSIRILTNNPKKIRGLEGYGLSVTEQVPIEHAPNPHNEEYMRVKAQRMGHILHHQGLNLDEEMLAEEHARDLDAKADLDARMDRVERPPGPAGRADETHEQGET